MPWQNFAQTLFPRGLAASAEALAQRCHPTSIPAFFARGMPGRMRTRAQPCTETTRYLHAQSLKKAAQSLDVKVVFPGTEKLLKLCRMSGPNATREQNSGKQHRRANVECAEGVI